MALRVGGLHHIALKSSDPAGLARFYRETLGLPEERRQTDARGLRSVWLEASGVLLMIERAESPNPGTPLGEDPPGLHLLALRIEARDRLAFADRLAERGHRVLHETSFTLYFRDPEGNRLALSHWPDPFSVEHEQGSAR